MTLKVTGFAEPYTTPRWIDMKKQLSHPLKVSMWSLQYHTWKGSKTFSKKTILSSTQNLKIKFRWPKIVINISTTLCVLWNNMFNDPEEISKLLKEYICVILKISWKNTFFTIFTPKIRVCTYYTVHLLRNFRYISLQHFLHLPQSQIFHHICLPPSTANFFVYVKCNIFSKGQYVPTSIHKMWLPFYYT